MGKCEGENKGKTTEGLVNVSLALNGLFPFRALERKEKAPEDFTKYFQMMGEMTELGGNKSGNFMYSPASLYSALQTAAYGADGKTYREIIKLTGKRTYDLKSEAVNAWDFLVVNGKKGLQAKIREEYKKILKTDRNLNATVYELTNDNCGQLVNEINSRCRQETNGQISEAVSPADFQDVSPLDPFTAFLGNVLHFKGTWRKRGWLNKNFYFIGKDGERRQVDAVNMESDVLHYYCNDTVEAFNAPYQEDGGRYTFWGFLSSGNAGDCDISKLDLSGLKEPEGGYNLHVKIPKFLFRSEMDMTEALKRFGVSDAFDRQNADFSKGFFFSEKYNVCLNSVKQQTVIDFNERGTEASAFTGIALAAACTCIGEREIRLNFDRPFYFMIWDEGEKLPLFVGQVFAV